MHEPNTRPPFDSLAFGTGLSSLVKRCEDPRRPADPPAPASGPTLSLAFSGGGFRATLAALGVVRYLADAGLLANVRYVSSVSGGSIANGMVACNYDALAARGFSADAVNELVVNPIVKKLSSRSLKWSLARGMWRTIGSTTRTDVLASRLDSWWLDQKELEELNPQCRFIINAANLTTGVRFGFERDVIGDYVLGVVPTAGSGIRVAQAVAASASVPGVFAATKLPDLDFPCPVEGGAYLVDGGVYDNTGLEALDGGKYRNVFSITMNAGGLFATGFSGKIPIARDLSRSQSVLYRQSTALRTRWMVDRFKSWDASKAANDQKSYARRGLLFALATNVKPNTQLDEWTARYPEHRTWEGEDLAFVPTVFDKLDAKLCRALIYRGWWLTGANFARWYPDIGPLPADIEPPML